ncbi:ABC transporter ATP-binding protein [Roseomonas aeriglobus]|nr:ABC transporter ATP-binding protein [Roseomonas aeriglobus]MBN2973931.1 ABC transporter ATP-binding protein [Roseomonas aeriglobus]MBN2974389.1 ABC transporter ATP-binding protein [Roseomonas aeriglobus]
MSPLIEARGVSRRFGSGATQTTAVDSVDFDLHAGSFVGVIGPSGCGKSTLLNLIGLLDAPSAGTLRIGEEIVTPGKLDRRIARLRRDRIGFLFQDAGLLANMSVIGNLTLPLRYMGWSGKRAREKAFMKLAEYHLHGFADRPVDNLSGGERQRIALLRALLKEPAILICDEPTASLDEANSLAVIDALAASASRGTLVVCSTHDPLVMGRLSRRLAMHRGRLEADE